MTEASLILFDVDGTIFNSKPIILNGFIQAFENLGIDVPDERSITRTIGLSLEEAVKTMAPNQDDEGVAKLCAEYKSVVSGIYTSAPFYVGMRRLIGALAQYPHLILGAATGKNRKGLDPMLESNGMSGWFHVRQTPDDHPSKPHPSMILGAMKDHGIKSDRVVMIGDTSFDIDMAHNAGVKSIGVSWGYHGEELVNSKPTALVDCPSDIYHNIKNWGLI